MRCILGLQASLYERILHRRLREQVTRGHEAQAMFERELQRRVPRESAVTPRVTSTRDARFANIRAGGNASDPFVAATLRRIQHD